MLLRRDPYVAITPAAEISEFLHFLMIVLDIIFDRQTGRIEYADIAAESEENTRRFERQES